MNRRSKTGAELYPHLYNTKRWRSLRDQALTRDGYECQRCGVMLTKSAKPQVHHKVKHHGDPVLFWDINNCESVCASCHSGPIAREEARGYSDAIGRDGLPLDPRHPFNR